VGGLGKPFGSKAFKLKQSIILVLSGAGHFIQRISTLSLKISLMAKNGTTTLEMAVSPLPKPLYRNFLFQKDE